MRLHPRIPANLPGSYPRSSERIVGAQACPFDRLRAPSEVEGLRPFKGRDKFAPLRMPCRIVVRPTFRTASGAAEPQTKVAPVCDRRFASRRLALLCRPAHWCLPTVGLATAGAFVDPNVFVGRYSERQPVRNWWTKDGRFCAFCAFLWPLHPVNPWLRRSRSMYRAMDPVGAQACCVPLKGATRSRPYLPLRRSRAREFVVSPAFTRENGFVASLFSLRCHL